MKNFLIFRDNNKKRSIRHKVEWKTALEKNDMVLAEKYLGIVIDDYYAFEGRKRYTTLRRQL